MKNKKLHILLILALITQVSFSQPSFTQSGRASYYSDVFHGKKTASGEVYNKTKLTAAHRTLAFGTLVKVTNTKNNKSVIVKINDRGPFGKGRIIDLSKAAARQIDMITDGVANVKIESVNNKDIPNTPKPTNTRTFAIGKTYSMWGTEKKPEGYGIQIGSFGLIDNAKNLCREMIDQHYEEVYIQVSEVGARKIYRVLIGAFSSKSKAKGEEKVLAGIGYDGFPKKHLE